MKMKPKDHIECAFDAFCKVVSAFALKISWVDVTQLEAEKSCIHAALQTQKRGG